MKLFSYGKDGGPDSTVWGYWLVEIKNLFSIALLCFEDGSRDAYHEHAFNSVSWVISGRLYEASTIPIGSTCVGYKETTYRPSLLPIYTSRDCMHKVSSSGRTWVLTFRGPWNDHWREWLPERQKFQTLTHGRRKVEDAD